MFNVPKLFESAEWGYLNNFLRNLDNSDIDLRVFYDNEHETLLHKTAKYGGKDYDKLSYLLIHNKGLSLVDRNVNGKTPLHIACQNENAFFISLAFSNTERDHFSSYLELVDTCGNTPLHEACKLESYKMVLALAMHGAKFDVKNLEGNKPVLLAKKDVRIIQILQVIEHLFKLVTEDKNQWNKDGKKKFQTILKPYLQLSQELQAIIFSKNSDNQNLIQKLVTKQSHDILFEILKSLFDYHESIFYSPTIMRDLLNYKQILADLDNHLHIMSVGHDIVDAKEEKQFVIKYYESSKDII